jgi:SPP1 gp7 family putative phage head morphogenesis protein
VTKLTLDMTADPSEFTEACEDFATRKQITRTEADLLDAYARRRSFWITGVAQMDILNDVQKSILSAMKSGESIQSWRKSIRETLYQQWGTRDAARLDTVFINATMQGYNAGRWQQAKAPHVRAVRPYAMFDGVEDSRQTEICAECNDTILPVGDPWWDSHSPQLHHRCRSGIRTLRADTANKLGLTMVPPQPKIIGSWGVNPLLAEPPKPGQRTIKPDSALLAELYRKASKDASRKGTTIPKRSVKKD